MNIRIILADDHKIVREGLRTLIERQPDMEVVAEAENGRRVMDLAREFSPDVIIMDIAMPDLNGIDATRHIVVEFPNVKVVVLSMYCDKRFVVEVLKAGASGYLLKDCAFEELAHAIRSVIAGEVYLSSKVASVIIKDYMRHLPEDESSAFYVLTAREREVLQLLAEGKTTKQIASLLHISVKTVETHRRQIMSKLDIHSIAELTKYAIREGLTSLS
jgi:DNA-binding NarL/FixJ family response regulator